MYGPFKEKISYVEYGMRALYHYMSLKGMFAKNEKGYRLNVIKKRFSSLLILLLLRLLENC